MISLAESSSSTALVPTINDEPLVERYFEDAIRRQMSDYLVEHYGWRGNLPDNGKLLPYDSCDSLREVRNIGRKMAKKPSIISATSKLISYVIGKGHQYKIAPRIAPQKRSKGKINRTKEVLQATLDLALEELGWLSHQEEFYNRLIRDGEVFRRIWKLDGEVDITYIEPEEIEQPTSRNQIIGDIPANVAALFDRNGKPPGILGIITKPNDVRKVIGYWLKRDNGKYEFLTAADVQHITDGVDKNDPRGIPRFYWAYCHVVGIDEVDTAMRTLFLVQAKHAAVYRYDQGAVVSQMQRILNQQQEDDAQEGRVAQPGTVYAKGFNVDLPGIKVASRDAIEIIQQEQRLIGGCSDIPEHLISEDANTGNRSSLVAAEGPFDRRVQREQKNVWASDRSIVWQVLKQSMGWSVADSKEAQLVWKMTVDAPAAHSRDWDKTVETEMLQLQNQIKSRPQVRQTLGVDSQQADEEIAEDPLAIVMPVGQTNGQAKTQES